MILLTGYKGYLGSLLFEKVDAIGIDLKDGMNLITCDLPKDIDVIYHLAAQSSVESSWHDPVYDADNLRMTIRLVKEYPNARIIYANSAAAKSPIMSPYGFSKWASGEYIKTFHKDYVICTFPNVYGRNNKSVVDIFKNSDEVIVYGDGLQIRDYVHVDDIVEGLLLAKDWPKGEYEMGSGIATSVFDLAKGKKVTFAPARKEARESVLKNTTPNWKSTINIFNYLNL